MSTLFRKTKDIQCGWISSRLWYLHHKCTGLCLSHIQPRAPYDFYHPYDFLPVKAEWSARIKFYVSAVLVVTSGYRPHVAWHLWFGRIICSTPRVPYAIPVRESSMLFICYGMAPLQTAKGIDTTRICKNPAQASYLVAQGSVRTGPVRAPHGLITISKPVRGS